MRSRVLFIDNRDSFTYNLVDELRVLGLQVEVRRSDRPAAELMARLDADTTLVLSPGPGAPERAGCLIELVRLAMGRVPILGICLGHQALVHALGGRVGAAPEPRHGRSSVVHHAGHAAFTGIPSPFNAGRYHSLCALALPETLVEIARSEDSVTMAVVGRDAPLLGLQFHPESILTPQGRPLLRNAFAWLARRRCDGIAA